MAQPTIGVFAAAFDDQGRILCVLQAYGQMRSTNPGGRLDDGEDPGAVRFASCMRKPAITAPLLDFWAPISRSTKRP